MNAFLLWSTLLVPLSLALLQSVAAGRRLVRHVTPWAAAPALLLVTGDTFTIDVPWLLLGTRLGVDPVGRVFLGLTAVLWLAAGCFARPYLTDDTHRARFQAFFLVTMAGNLGSVVAQDVVSFLTCFTLMGLASYGLIAHDGQGASLRAGRIYLTMTIAGELLLFAAIVPLALESESLHWDRLSAQLAATPHRSLLAGLLLAGFGIKLGVMPLHMWLPLAHPAAPTPASAVLSGSIIKTGLLGLMRILPLGAVALDGWGNACLLAGVTSCVAGALIGLTQRNPKTILAYSSISQMGLITVGLGAALKAPAAWPLIAPALLLWAAHHAVAKASLFLGTGVANVKSGTVWADRAVGVGLVLGASALAGLPGTTGYAAKLALKEVVSLAGDGGSAVAWILPWTSVTTALLMARFLWCVWSGRQAGHRAVAVGMVAAWAVLTTGVAGGFVALWQYDLVDAAWLSLGPATSWNALWPILAAGLATWWAVRRPAVLTAIARMRVPEGDLVIPVAAMARAYRLAWNRLAVIQLPRWFRGVRHTAVRRGVPALARLQDGATRVLENDSAAGLLVVLTIVVLFILSLW